VSFEKAVAFVLTWEGGYSDDPDDAGSETNFGISKRAYPHLDIKNLTKEEAINIYFNDYWLKAGCDALEDKLATIVFDTAVNLGVSRAKGFLTDTTDWRDYLISRIARYNEIAKLGNNIKFLRGWLNRTISLYRATK
jgi:lysozyme family protein